MRSVFFLLEMRWRSTELPPLTVKGCVVGEWGWGVGPGHCSQRMLSDAGNHSAGKHGNGVSDWGRCSQAVLAPPHPEFLLLGASWPILEWQQAGTWASVLPPPFFPLRILSSSLNLQASELWGLGCCPSVHTGDLTPGTRHMMKLRLHLAHLFFWLLAVGPSFQHLNTGAEAHTLVWEGNRQTLCGGKTHFPVGP